MYTCTCTTCTRVACIQCTCSTVEKIILIQLCCLATFNKCIIIYIFYVYIYMYIKLFSFIDCVTFDPAGAGISIENSEGDSPLQIAEYAKHSEVIKLLRDAEEAGVASPNQNTEGVCACACVCVRAFTLYMYCLPFISSSCLLFSLLPTYMYMYMYLTSFLSPSHSLSLPLTQRL